MIITLPEDVSNAHVHVGTVPGLRLRFNLKDLTRIMDKWRIGHALVFSSHVRPDLETSHIIKAMNNDRRLYGLVRSHPPNYSTPGFLKWFTRLLQENSRVVGVKLNPSTEKHKVTETLYAPTLEILNDQEAVLLLHCGRWVEMSGWQYGIEIANKYPKIKVILAHLGGTHPDLSFEAIAASKEISNIYMDTSQTRQIDVIRHAIQELGSDRILFGSDMPWGDYVQNLIGIVQLALPETVMNKILRQNFNILIKGEGK